jgi:urate oxidase
MGASNYGKAEIRSVKVTRHPDRHDLRDLTVDVVLEGDFEATYVKGDNTGRLATPCGTRSTHWRRITSP